MSNLPSMRACSPTTVRSVIADGRPGSGVVMAGTVVFCALLRSANIPESSLRAKGGAAEEWATATGEHHLGNHLTLHLQLHSWSRPSHARAPDTGRVTARPNPGFAP